MYVVHFGKYSRIYVFGMIYAVMYIVRISVHALYNICVKEYPRMVAKQFRLMLVTTSIFAVTGFQAVEAQATATATVTTPTEGLEFTVAPGNTAYVPGQAEYEWSYMPQAGNPSSFSIQVQRFLMHGGQLTDPQDETSTYPNVGGALIHPNPQTRSTSGNFAPTHTYSTKADITVTVRTPDTAATTLGSASGTDTKHWVVDTPGTQPSCDPGGNHCTANARLGSKSIRPTYRSKSQSIFGR